MKQKQNQPAAGFALIEALLIIVIIALVAGVGYWVWAQRKTTKSSTSSTAAPDTAAIKTDTTAGYAEFIDQNTTETDQTTDTQANTYTESALSDSAAANSLGDSYNVSF